MSRLMTTDDLVLSLQRRAMLPKAQETFSKQDFIDILNEEMEHGVVPHVLEVYEEYLVVYEDRVTGLHVTTDNIEEFTIPTRATGNKLRGLQLVGTSGNIVDLSRIKIEDLLNYNYYSGSIYGISSFYIKNNTVVLIGTSIVGTNSLRMWYYLRPSTLVENKFAAVITAIDYTTGAISVDKIPTTFNSTALYDITNAKNPNKLVIWDKSLLSLNTNAKIMNFTPTDITPDKQVSQIKVGDYITIAETSIVPQLPQEVHPLLAQRGALACLEAMGDAPGCEIAAKKLEELERNTWDLLDNRVESAVEKIVSNYTCLGRFRNIRSMRRGGY